MIPVNQIYESIQGEGHFTGAPSIFLRLQGCDVGCQWCDTKETWKLDTAFLVKPDEVLDKGSQLTRTWAWVVASDLQATIQQMPIRHVVITGGEPMVHFDQLQPVIGALCGQKIVQIETSGTVDVPESNLWVTQLDNLWITVSPKVDMPGLFNVHPAMVRLANEIKMPIAKKADVETLRMILRDTGARGEVWLQPVNQKNLLTQYCAEVCKEEGWRLSIQTHKYVNLP